MGRGYHAWVIKEWHAEMELLVYCISISLSDWKEKRPVSWSDLESERIKSYD
jgi:hypothetical protein